VHKNRGERGHHRPGVATIFVKEVDAVPGFFE
jgi:hypothetical protein